MDLYNEFNPYRAAVLREHIAAGRLPAGKVDERDITQIPDADFLGYGEIHLFAGIGGFPFGMQLAGFEARGRRIVTGGFPCQDISNAGKRAGIYGARSGLWREMVRCVRVVGPDFVFVENVAALLGRGMGAVLGDLAALGYDARWDCISAASVGAPHLRERIFIVAYPARRGFAMCGSTQPQRDASVGQPAFGGEALAHPARDGEWRPRAASGEQQIAPRRRSTQPSAGILGDTLEPRLEGFAGDGADGAERQKSDGPARETGLRDADAIGRDGWENNEWQESPERNWSACAGWWAIEPNVGRVAHGVPARVDRLAALGDAIVPQCVAEMLERQGLVPRT